MPLPNPSGRAQSVFHVTVVSNFARAFDKYGRGYDKNAIAQSTYPHQFYVLEYSELLIGIEKASALLEKLALPGNRLLVLEAHVDSRDLLPNLRNGKGRVLPSSSLPVAAVHWWSGEALVPTTVEEAYAVSLRLLTPALAPYASLRPRTLSVLPVARACQAKCRFCFSESSASLDQKGKLVDAGGTDAWARAAKAAGAERFVITGGGEPGLLRHDQMLALMHIGKTHLEKVVLITNGVHLARQPLERRLVALEDYRKAGLSVFSLSCHHDSPARNSEIMGLDTGATGVLSALRAHRQRTIATGERTFRTRLICVLQKGGVESVPDVKRYLKWAVEQGVDEVCFKELYVSTQQESAYHEQPENAWSHAHQVPLSVVLEAANDLGLQQCLQLPWGAPVFSGVVNDAPIKVAAYTEPSLYWERANGVARSWNLMADTSCLASLEDPQSLLRLSANGAVRNALPRVSADAQFLATPAQASPESLPC